MSASKAGCATSRPQRPIWVDSRGSALPKAKKDRETLTRQQLLPNRQETWNTAERQRRSLQERLQLTPSPILIASRLQEMQQAGCSFIVADLSTFADSLFIHHWIGWHPSLQHPAKNAGTVDVRGSGNAIAAETTPTTLHSLLMFRFLRLIFVFT